MAKVAYIDPYVCDGDLVCMPKKACIANAILHDKVKRLYSVEENKCTGCGVCIRYCPHGAIVMKKR